MQAVGEVGVELCAVESAQVVAHDEALGERFVAGHGEAAAQLGESDEQQAQAVLGVHFVIAQQAQHAAAARRRRPRTRQAVTMWTRPADRAPSYGPYGQGVDKCAALAHPLPTLAALATHILTASAAMILVSTMHGRLRRHRARQDQRAHGAMLDEEPAPRSTPHCKVTKARLRSQPGWPMASPVFNQGRNHPANPGERGAAAPGPSTPGSRSSVAGILVKCSRNRRQVRRNPQPRRRARSAGSRVGRRSPFAWARSLRSTRWPSTSSSISPRPR